MKNPFKRDKESVGSDVDDKNDNAQVQEIELQHEDDTSFVSKDTLSNDAMPEEEIKVSKVYIYIAFKDDKIFIGKNGECILSNTIVEDNPENLTEKDWATQEITRSLYAKKEYRWELEKPDTSDKGQKKKWDDEKKKAKDDLKKKFSAEIESAKQAIMPVVEEDRSIPSIEEQIESVIPKTPEKKCKDENVETKVESTPKAVAPDLKGMEFKILSEIQQLSQDIGDSGSDTTEAISREINSTSDHLYNAIEKSGENATSASREMGSNVVQAIRSESANLSSLLQTEAKKSQEELLKGAKSIQKKVDKIDEICEATEMMEGKLAKLDQLETIASILSEKGVEISRDFPPTCEEEEDIINLVRYSKKITEQLGYAARELIRKKAHYDSKDQSLANEQAIAEKKISDAREEGIAEGKLFVLKSLLSKYADVDTIMESEYDHVHVLWSLMQELDVYIDGNGEYKKGTVIELTEEEAERMAAIYKKIEGSGKYRVIKSGLKYGNDIIFKAEFEKITDEDVHIESGESIEEKNADSIDGTANHEEVTINDNAGESERTQTEEEVVYGRIVCWNRSGYDQ